MKLTKILAILAVCLTITACTRQIDLSDQAEFNSNSAVEQELPELSPESTLIEATAGDYTFYHVPGWQVQELPLSSGGQAEMYLRLKSTDKQIVLGGAAPDDYYVEALGLNVVNSAKYATSYMQFNVDVYQSLKDLEWSEFFDQVWPEVVSDFQIAQVPYRPELAAVEVVETEAVFSGQKRYFIKTEKAIYDVALHFSDDLHDQAILQYNQFLGQFPF